MLSRRVLMLLLRMIVLMIRRRDFCFQRFEALLFHSTIWRLTFERPPGQFGFGENETGLQLPRDATVAFEYALHLFPANKFVHLFGQLPELFKIDVAITETNGPEIRRKKRGLLKICILRTITSHTTAKLTDSSSPRSESTSP